MTVTAIKNLVPAASVTVRFAVPGATPLINKLCPLTDAVATELLPEKTLYGATPPMIRNVAIFALFTVVVEPDETVNGSVGITNDLVLGIPAGVVTLTLITSPTTHPAKVTVKANGPSELLTVMEFELVTWHKELPVVIPTVLLVGILFPLAS